jgi:glycosyltransferase involved in cell wall biosynthesis
VPDEVLPKLLAGANSVAMVGLREGFGLPALEALATGRPVFASNTGALPEVVGDLGALCDPFSEDSIREALDRTVGDQDLRARVVSEGPASARERGWGATAQKLVEICLAAARGHGDRGKSCQ